MKSIIGFLGLIGCILLPAPFVQAASLSLIESTELNDLSVGDTFDLTILFDDNGGAGLSGFGIHLNFDDSVLAYTGTVFDARLTVQSQGSLGTSGFEVFNIAAFSQFPIVPEGALVTGSDAAIAVLGFQVVGAGSTIVDVTAASPIGFATVYAASSGFTPLNPASPVSASVVASVGPVIPLPAAGIGALSGLAILFAMGAARRR